MRIRKEENFISGFDERSGRYFRTGVLENGHDTGVDPFMASFPELLDVGIMGHCIHGRTGLCVKAGVECYQDGLHACNPNMSLKDFEALARQCQGKTYQFALGGCGDPDQHEDFEEILQLCRKYDIVPNFTTSGYGMTEHLAGLCKKYCGAVAVSWYRSPYTLRALKTLLSAGVKTNIHYVLSKSTVEEGIAFLLGEAEVPEGINAVVFLLHKPVGLGSKAEMLAPSDNALHKFMEILNEVTVPFKVGFDSCTIPGLLNLTNKFDIESMDTCEGARWSAYVSADMKMMPCSFDNQEQRWAVDLRSSSVQEAWNSQAFDDFRNYFRKSCPSCEKKDQCMGGCPIRPEIVLCRNKH